MNIFIGCKYNFIWAGTSSGQQKWNHYGDYSPNNFLLLLQTTNQEFNNSNLYQLVYEKLWRSLTFYQDQHLKYTAIYKEMQKSRRGGEGSGGEPFKQN